MKPLLLAAAIAVATGGVVIAQDIPKPEPNALPSADQASPPDTKARIAPEAPQPMESTAGTKAPGFIPDEQWVGRYVYSSDNKDLGKISAVKTNEVDFDMGGFLGLGATRKHVTTDQVGSVQSDRIILRLTKAEAEKLPAYK